MKAFERWQNSPSRKAYFCLPANDGDERLEIIRASPLVRTKLHAAQVEGIPQGRQWRFIVVVLVKERLPGSM